MKKVNGRWVKKDGSLSKFNFPRGEKKFWCYGCRRVIGAEELKQGEHGVVEGKTICGICMLRKEVMDKKKWREFAQEYLVKQPYEQSADRARSAQFSNKELADDRIRRDAKRREQEVLVEYTNFWIWDSPLRLELMFFV